MDSESNTPETSAIDDLVTEQLDGGGQAPVVQEAAPVSDAAPQVEVASQSEPVQAQAVGQPDPNAQALNQPTEQTYRIGNREYTAKEIQDAFTTAQQLPVVQNKYLSVLEQQRQSQAQQSQGQQVQPQAPQYNPQQVMANIKAKYEPEIQKLVKDGMISGDFAALFPGELSQMLMYRDGYDRLAQRQAQVESFIQGQQQQTQSQGLMAGLGQSISALAQSGEAFAPLKDPNEVQGFFQYLWNMDPKVGLLKNPDFLADQFVAYKRNMFLQQHQAQQVNAQRANQVRMAQGAAATGTRAPGSMSESPKSPLDLLTDDFYDRSA